MQRRKMLKAAATVATPWLIPALSQSRVRRIGVLYPWIDPGTAPPGAAAFWKQHGWIVGDTLNIERRYAAWRVERMPEFADDLLRRFDVELLMAFGPEAAAAAARATRTVPIVFIGAYLPVECGLIDSYARPGRNCTGLADQGEFHMVSKRLEFLRAVAPSVRRAAVLAPNPEQFTLSGAALDIQRPYAEAAKSVGLELSFHFARKLEDVETVLADVRDTEAQIAIISGYCYIGTQTSVIDSALRRRWITATLNPDLLRAGLLIYHGPTDAEFAYMSTRWAETADRILRGANPADIPVEQAARHEFVINRKTARAIGLTLPQSLLLRADRMIE